MNERSTTEHVTYERSPNDALRLIAAAVVTLVGCASLFIGGRRGRIVPPDELESRT